MSYGGPIMTAAITLHGASGDIAQMLADLGDDAPDYEVRVIEGKPDTSEARRALTALALEVPAVVYDDASSKVRPLLDWIDTLP